MTGVQLRTLYSSFVRKRCTTVYPRIGLFAEKGLKPFTGLIRKIKRKWNNGTIGGLLHLGKTRCCVYQSVFSIAAPHARTRTQFFFFFLSGVVQELLNRPLPTSFYDLDSLL